MKMQSMTPVTGKGKAMKLKKQEASELYPVATPSTVALSQDSVEASKQRFKLLRMLFGSLPDLKKTTTAITGNPSNRDIGP